MGEEKVDSHTHIVIEAQESTGKFWGESIPANANRGILTLVTLHNDPYS